ncbi:MAG: Asp-tRNA(Asn)/Glu-tRNA(Gln) amidotransferase GatCAB subunit B, partial [Myxococcota bacterium]
VQETRLWDSRALVTRSMRSKEEAHDYRYFPEPDLPDLVLEAGLTERIGDAMPELPSAKLGRYIGKWGLSAVDARVLTDDAAVAEFFEAAVAVHDNNKAIANWVINEVLRELKDRTIGELPITPEALAELVALIDDGTISGKIAKDVFAELIAGGGSPRAIVKAKGLEQVTDTGSIEPVIDQVLADNPDSVKSFKAGKTKAIGFLVGQVLQATQGKANPSLVNEILRQKLSY